MAKKKPEWVKPWVSTVTGREVRSRHSEDGSYTTRIPRPRTVGDLASLLAQLPPSLPISGKLDVTWVNVGMRNESLSIDEDF